MPEFNFARTFDASKSICFIADRVSKSCNSLGLFCEVNRNRFRNGIRLEGANNGFFLCLDYITVLF